MALALHAVQTHTLLTLCQFATVDWDESDAYLRPQREGQSCLNGLMRPMWDFGLWAASYFSRICIYALTEDGFTDGFVPEVGFNRGDNASGESYQPGCVVVSGTLTVYPEVYIPFRGERLQVNNPMFSDDRRLCASSLAAAIRLADECVYGTRSKAGTVHPGKLQFYSCILQGDTVVQRSAEVVGYQTTTSMEPPSVVGIPFTHHAYPRARIREIGQAACRLHARVQAATICVVLALHAYLAYVISPLDYIGSGVYTPPAEIQSMQVAVHKYWRKVLGLPPWTKLDHLYQTLHCGGPGCPKLEVRLLLLLLLTYMSGLYSRNEYTIAAAHYLLSEPSPTSKGRSLLHHILPWGLNVAALPSDTHPEAPIHVEGDVTALLQSATLVAATDAAIFDRVHSCLVIL